MSTPQRPTSLPWEEGFVPQLPDINLINQITGVVEKGLQDATAAATNLGAGVANQIPGVGPAAGTVIRDVGQAAQAAEQVGGTIVTTMSGGGGGGAPGTMIPTAIPASTTTPAGGIDIGQAALEAAKSVSGLVLPGLEKLVINRVATQVQNELTSLLTKAEGGAEDVSVPSLEDFTKADARSRAFRTLLVGLVVSVLWGLINIVGNLATVNWADKNALPQVVALAVGSILTSVAAYVGRFLKEPSHIANATIIPGPSK